tara:strand:- start:3112 stop:3393 length:282 start_codon:yes stop_codon:yes gene_type:complete
MNMVEWFMEEVIDAEGNRTQTRVLSEDEAREMLRQIRTPLLEETDLWMSVDRYNSLSAERQTELTTYRQALRDAPQSSDPFNPDFPTKPSWMV